MSTIKEAIRKKAILYSLTIDANSRTALSQVIAFSGFMMGDLMRHHAMRGEYDESSQRIGSAR